jgi:hypothetical protein
MGHMRGYNFVEAKLYNFVEAKPYEASYGQGP